MASKTMKAAHRANGGDLRKLQSGRADTSENSESLHDLQAHYLGVVFGLAPDTAVTIAQLVFGGGAHE